MKKIHRIFINEKQPVTISVVIDIDIHLHINKLSERQLCIVV